MIVYANVHLNSDGQFCAVTGAYYGNAADHLETDIHRDGPAKDRRRAQCKCRFEFVLFVIGISPIFSLLVMSFPLE